MNTNIYKEYTDLIANSLKYGKRRGAINKGKQFSDLGDITAMHRSQIMNKETNRKLFESLEPLSVITGKKNQAHLIPGAHPDFRHLSDDLTENHYITTMFIDIKRSTSLFKKYTPDTVANITSTIQRAAMHTAWYFDGYVQRFHGDGLMLYFGGKSMQIGKSVENAITAASFFSYFMKNDLKQLFFEQGVDKIYTRIGIDSGIDEDVFWYRAGMGECSEVTTCSLHTSLAAHMQSFASSNGIMVGDNVKNYSSFKKEYFSVEDELNRYVFDIPEENFYYTQWNYDWMTFLKNHPSVHIDEQGKLWFVGEPNTESAPNILYLKEQTEGYRPYFHE